MILPKFSDFGGIVQLGERYDGIVKVESSSLSTSILNKGQWQTVGNALALQASLCGIVPHLVH